MKNALLSVVFTLSIGISACTTVPTASNNFLSRSDRLEAAKGVLGKRLATPPPMPPIAQNAKLRIDAVTFVSGATISQNITQQERSVIGNALSRAACNDFSKHFEIIESGAEATSAYKLRIGVARLEATSKAGAAVGVATRFVLPFVGFRPPIGLGGLTVEFELLGPTGDQSAAMIWSRNADVVTNAASSNIGDAYAFISSATSDFENLASRQTSTGDNSSIRDPFRGNPDPACDAFGKGPNGAVRVLGFLGLPLPPESVDAKPKP